MLTEREAMHLGVMVCRVDEQRARERSIVDQLGQATAAHWRRRAAAFEWARPRPDDFTGAASVDEIAEQNRRCADAAAACRLRADALERGALDPVDADELAELLADIGADWAPNADDAGVAA